MTHSAYGLAERRQIAKLIGADNYSDSELMLLDDKLFHKALFHFKNTRKMREGEDLVDYAFAAKTHPKELPEKALSVEEADKRKRKITQRAHDAVEDAKDELADYTRRWVILIGAWATMFVSMVTGVGITWVFGSWWIEIPILCGIGMLVATGFILDRFSEAKGLQLKQEVKKTERRLRDVLVDDDDC